MNPYPFAPLNHFTVPFSLTDKTPFTIAKNVPQIPGFCFGFPKPPSERPQNFRLRVDVQREINSKIEKTPQFPAAISRRRENFWSPTIWPFVSTTPNKRQPRTGLTTGPT